MGTIKIPAAEVLKKIYGETEESSASCTFIITVPSFLSITILCKNRIILW